MLPKTNQLITGKLSHCKAGMPAEIHTFIVDLILT
jgi:hypothetical protein